MYPHASRVVVVAGCGAIVDAIAPPGAPSRWAMSIQDRTAHTVMIWEPGHHSAVRVLDGPGWATVVRVEQGVYPSGIPPRGGGVFLLDAEETATDRVAVAGLDVAMAWLAESVPATPPHAGADAPHDDRVRLVPHDSGQVLPLRRTFDPALAFPPDHRVPPGLRVLGLFPAPDGPGWVRIDPQHMSGVALTGTTMASLVQDLGQEALDVPGAGGLMIDVATHAVFAVTIATGLSAVARQTLPAPVGRGLGAIMATLPPLVQEMLTTGRQFTTSASPAVRGLAALSGLVLIGLSASCYSLLWATSVRPIFWFIETTPGLQALVADPFVYRVPLWARMGTGESFSLGGVLAWLPTILEHLAVIYAASVPSWRRFFMGFVAVDVAATVIYWATVLGVRGETWGYGGGLLLLAVGLVGYGGVMVLLTTPSPSASRSGHAISSFLTGMLLTLVSLVLFDGATFVIPTARLLVSIGAGTFFALCWELIGFGSLVLGLSQLPALGSLFWWMLHTIGMIGIHGYYAAVSLGDTWGRAVAEERAHLGAQTLMVDAITGQSLTPSGLTVAAIGVGVSLLLVGIVGVLIALLVGWF